MISSTGKRDANLRVFCVVSFDTECLALVLAGAAQQSEKANQREATTQGIAQERGAAASPLILVEKHREKKKK